MNELLKPDQIIQTQSGQPCKVIKFLAEGGQGQVYRVQWGKGEYALKWYFPQSATPEQRQTLEKLIAQGAPSDKFLWPEDMATVAGGGFGYIMRLRPPEYKSLNDLVAGRINPGFTSLISAGIEITKAFRSLHTKGLCYRDISFGNAFFRPDTGDVLICDNDNVAENRTPVKSGVLGTPDFMAPEIVRMEALPSRTTDFHSLAVLLFYLFFVGHPLCGKKLLSIRCWDTAARIKLFGQDPVFIFDPQDQSNAAEPGDPEAGGNALGYWNVYPKAFRDTFIKAFIAGVKDPDVRVTELEWQDALAALRNSLFKCGCGKANFYDIETVKATGGTPSKCWGCGQVPVLPFCIRIGKAVVMLNADSKIYPHHMEDGRNFDFSEAMAEVVRHPTDPNIWGLKNAGKDKWVATLADGSVKDIDPGRSVPLARGNKIQFGKVEGEIRY